MDADTAKKAVTCLHNDHRFTYTAMEKAIFGKSDSSFGKWRNGHGPHDRVKKAVIEWLNKDVQDSSDDSAGDLSDGIKREPPDEDVASSDKETADGQKTVAPWKTIQPRVHNEDEARTFLLKWKNDHHCTFDDLAKVIGVTSKELSSWANCGHVGKKVTDWVNGDGGDSNHGDGDGGNYGDSGDTSGGGEHTKVEDEYVYIMTDNGERFKVGHSNNPYRRLADLRTGNPSLKLLDRFPVSSAKAEKEAHKALEKYRWTRSLEWFYGPYNEIKPLVIEAIRGYMLPM